jgi:quinoprotein glucose dehydrogenase
VLYVNATDVPCIATLVPARATPAPAAAPRSGAAVYASACAACHGADRRGDRDRSPSLVDVGARLSASAVREVIDRGRGFMPSFAGLPEAERRAVTAYLLGQPADDSPHAIEPPAPAADRAPRAPYRLREYERWRDPEGYPAVKPPWGMLHAIDLNTGEYRWSVVLGEFAALTARGVPQTGTPSYGGPIVTAGGLVFIGATQDERFRAFDKETGRLLWETRLPAAGYATPSTYAVNGRQYVVIAAGGGKLGTKSGDAYVAFALPE